MSGRESPHHQNYLFEDSEAIRIQILLSDLHNVISSSSTLPEKTKLKLLEKIEEILKHFTTNYKNLDIFWSFIGRAEIAFKVYEKTKVPNTLKELLEIIWNVQCRTEGRSSESSPPINLG